MSSPWDVASGVGVEPPVAEGPAAPEKRSAAAQLVDLAIERYTFGVTPGGEAFAVPIPRKHVVRPLRGGRTSLRAELASAFRRASSRVAPQQALADALLVIEGEAQESTPTETHLRVAEAEGAVWIDLGDVGETVVRVDADGWSLVAEGVPVLFRRTALTGELPAPKHGGDLEGLWAILNVAHRDRPLVLAWLVAALVRPSIPHPALAVFGEQGTGKSSATRALVGLVDPSPVPLRKPPRDPDGWVTAAAGSWVVALDNLSGVPDWLSDALCRAVTGDGDVRRQLYTDAGLAVFAFRRAVVLNGIDVGSMRGDLAERLVVMNLERISEEQRLTEHELADQWARVWAPTFGALLDLAAGVLRELPDIRLERSPRMADFALVVAAVDKVLGTAALDRYAEQSRTIAEDSLDADPFIGAMRSTLSRTWQGTSAELLDLISEAEDWTRVPKGWPASARVVTGILKRNAPSLRRAGWLVEDLGAGNKAGVTRWSITPSPANGGEAGLAGVESLPSQDGYPLPGGDRRDPPSHSPFVRKKGNATHPEIARIPSPPSPPCAICGREMTAGGGATTHPTCSPELER